MTLCVSPFLRTGIACPSAESAAARLTRPANRDLGTVGNPARRLRRDLAYPMRCIRVLRITRFAGQASFLHCPFQRGTAGPDARRAQQQQNCPPNHVVFRPAFPFPPPSSDSAVNWLSITPCLPPMGWRRPLEARNASMISGYQCDRISSAR